MPLLKTIPNPTVFYTQLGQYRVILDMYGIPKYNSNTMLEFQTTVTKKWQVTLPKQVRKLLKIVKPGKYRIKINPDTKAIYLIPIKKDPLLNLSGKLKPPKINGKKIDIVKIRDIMETQYARQ